LQNRPAKSAKAAGEVLTAKQAPHRPGTTPALGLRAGSIAVAMMGQTADKKRTCSNQRASYSVAFHRRFNNVHARSLLAALIMVGNGEIA